MHRESRPSSLPTRASRAPPTRPSVRSIVNCAFRASRIARRPSKAEPQVASVPWTIVTSFSWRAATYPPTVTRRPRIAHASEALAASFLARALLLLIRASNGGGWDRTADHACHGDQRQDVLQRLEERRRVVRVGRQPERERCGEAEQERSGEGSVRPPVPEDQRRERDEATAGGDGLVECVQVANRQVRAPERRQDAGENDRPVTDEVDVDPDGVGCPRMLPARADAQPDRRLEHDDVRDRDEQDRRPDHVVQAHERVPEERVVRVLRQVQLGDLRDAGRDVLAVVELHEEVARYPQRQEVDSRPADDLIGSEMDREEGGHPGPPPPPPPRAPPPPPPRLPTWPAPHTPESAPITISPPGRLSPTPGPSETIPPI